MALPIPSVVADVGPGGPLVSSMRGANALTSENLDNITKGAQAQYAPYTQYADAASKIAYAKMLPYQTQAQLLTNPMLWMALKDHPEIAKGMMDKFSSSMPDPNQLLSGLPAPTMQTRGNGLLGMLLDKLGIGGGQGGGGSNAMTAAVPGLPSPDSNSGNALNVSPAAQQGGSPLVPATQGSAAAVGGKITAPYEMSPYTSGSLIPDPNNPGGTISVPTEKTKTASQNAINAAKRVEPQLQRLADQASPFLSATGMIGKTAEQGWNYLFPHHAGLLPTKYADFQSTLKAAPEALVKAYGLSPTNETIQRMQEVIEPVVGETGPQYKERILRSLENLQNEQVGVSQSQLSGGFELPSGKKAADASSSTGDDTSTAGVSKWSPLKLLDYKYKPGEAGRKQFLESFNTLSPEAQQQVRDEISRRKSLKKGSK